MFDAGQPMRFSEFSVKFIESSSYYAEKSQSVEDLIDNLNKDCLWKVSKFLHSTRVFILVIKTRNIFEFQR